MTSTMTSLFSTRARTALGALSVAAVLTLSACGGSGSSDSDAGKDASKDASSSASPSAGASDGAAEGPQPDLDAIPDVVAEVNGEEVTKEEFVPIYEAAFQQAAAQAQMGGEDPDEEALRKETADNLVDTELLLQEAESRGLEVSDEAVEAELTSLAEQNGMKTADELLDEDLGLDLVAGLLLGHAVLLDRGQQLLRGAHLVLLREVLQLGVDVVVAHLEAA